MVFIGQRPLGDLVGKDARLFVIAAEVGQGLRACSVFLVRAWDAGPAEQNDGAFDAIFAHQQFGFQQFQLQAHRTQIFAAKKVIIREGQSVCTCAGSAACPEFRARFRHPDARRGRRWTCRPSLGFSLFFRIAWQEFRRAAKRFLKLDTVGKTFSKQIEAVDSKSLMPNS